MENETYSRYNFRPITTSHTPEISAVSSSTTNSTPYESFTKPIASSNIYYNNPYAHPNTPEAVEVQDYRFKDIPVINTPTEQPVQPEKKDRTVEAFHLVGNEIDDIKLNYTQLRDEIETLAAELKETKEKLDKLTGNTSTSNTNTNYYANQYAKQSTQEHSGPVIDVTAKDTSKETYTKPTPGEIFAQQLREKLDAMKNEKPAPTPAEAFADQVREKLRILKEEKARQAVIDAQRPKETVPAGGFYWSR